MRTTADKVLDRLSGIKPEDRKRIQNTRRTRWYAKWNDLADFLNTNPTKRQIMMRAFHLVEQCGGHKYDHIAYASRDANKLVCDERGWK